VGGLIGAVWMARGHNSVLWGWEQLIGPAHQLVGVSKIVAALIVSPVLGFCTAFLLQKGAKFLLRNANYRINSGIKKVQWILAGLLAYSHAGNEMIRKKLQASY